MCLIHTETEVLPQIAWDVLWIYILSSDYVYISVNTNGTYVGCLFLDPNRISEPSERLINVRYMSKLKLMISFISISIIQSMGADTFFFIEN